MKVFFKHITVILCGVFILSALCSCTSFSEAKQKKREKWIFDNYLLEAQSFTNRRKYLSAIKTLNEMNQKFPSTEKVMTNYLIGYNYYELKSYKVAKKYLDSVFFLFRELTTEEERAENEKFTVLATLLLEKIDHAENVFDPYEVKPEIEKMREKKIKPAF